MNSESIILLSSISTGILALIGLCVRYSLLSRCIKVSLCWHCIEWEKENHGTPIPNIDNLNNNPNLNNNSNLNISNV